MIQLYEQIETLEDVQADFSDRLIPQGTRGTIVECYQNPEAYAVDLAIPCVDDSGLFDYENVILSPEQFVVVKFPVSNFRQR